MPKTPLAQPRAAMVVIGDEILSGRTQDSNLHHLAGQLSARGIALTEARVIGDDRATIITTIRHLSDAFDLVFTSGGIGPTHDDITAEAVAEALGAPIGIRDDARALLQAHYDSTGQELNAARLRMARIPDGATLIENPISAAPGFVLGNVHVMAGVPVIFEAMLATVLPGLTGGTPLLSQTVPLARGEGDIATPLGEIATRNPEISVGSYPFLRDGKHGLRVVLRGTDAEQLARVAAEVETLG